MKRNLFLPTAVLVLLGLFSCKVQQNHLSAPPEDSGVQVVSDSIAEADTTAETRALEYKGEATRHFRLHHTKLELSFDWDKQWVIGKALLIVEPYFYDQSELELDAKDFDIHYVFMKEGDSIRHLNYWYNGKKMTIELGKEYARGEKLNIIIEYTAKPNEGDSIQDIWGKKDKKGLYFINPHGDKDGEPRQIWTLGETSSNSKWFPTIDEPNQKSTQEMFITVEDHFETLSNGKLIYSRDNGDGTRTDYWRMDKPHAPYLFMLAVGDFSIINDKWGDMDVNYYVEPAYEEYADDIFGNTPEMIGFYSRILHYPFPWIKYSQIVVRDFVTGAMENTTASVFMEDLNVNDRELIDYDWDDIIAHELFHQWFGDLVTCESWANLPLNESFATYGEYLWINYKKGKDEADYHLYQGLDEYLVEATTKQEDLIRFYYHDPDEMFDSHSYNKGGLVLHALRNYVGDSAFFKSLEFYLKSHEYGKAEIHDLRLAFEHITGEDLNWFFDQWFLSAGHPQLKIEEGIHEKTGEYIIKVKQTQDTDLYPVFNLPLVVDIWQDGQMDQYLMDIDQIYHEFLIEGVSDPDLVLVDSEYIIIGEIDQDKSPEQYIYQFKHYPDNVRARLEALDYFLAEPKDSLMNIFIGLALDDSFWVIRQDILDFLEKDSTERYVDYEKKIVAMALHDPNPLVKASAITALAAKNMTRYVDIYKANLYDSSYSVASAALYAYLQCDPENAKEISSKFKQENNFTIASSIADYYIKKKDYNEYDWFEGKLHEFNGSDLWYFIKIFGMYLIDAPDPVLKKGIQLLKEIGLKHNQFYNRLSAYQSLQLFSDHEGIQEILDEIKEAEKDPRIRIYYN